MCFSYDRDVRADLVHIIVVAGVFERGAAELLGYVRCHRCCVFAALADGCFGCFGCLATQQLLNAAFARD